jgi:hypothetical protein
MPVERVNRYLTKVLEEEVPTELKVLLTLTGTLTSLIITPL